jgi:hypothetical protein
MNHTMFKIEMACYGILVKKKSIFNLTSVEIQSYSASLRIIYELHMYVNSCIRITYMYKHVAKYTLDIPLTKDFKNLFSFSNIKLYYSIYYYI